MPPLTDATRGVGNPGSQTYPVSDMPHPATAADPTGTLPFPSLLGHRTKPHGKRRALTKKNGRSGEGATPSAARGDPTAGGELTAAPDAAQFANPSQWFRAESRRETPAIIVRPPWRISPHQRVLVASSGTRPEALIEIRSGRLAGSQIRLVASGHHVEARLLTANAASRQTLVAAMETVRLKLHEREERGSFMGKERRR